MRLMRLGAPGTETPVVATADGRMLDLTPLTPDIDGAFPSGAGLWQTQIALMSGQLRELAGADRLRVAPPVARPGKVVCIGLNYRDHAQETGAAIPQRPVVFLKAADTVVGPYDEVLIPRGSSRTDWEVELAVVIGRTARYLSSPSAALEYVAGYAVSHDVSEREFPLEYSAQWDLGTSCETFNPLGPWLVTRDEIPDPQALGLRLSVNGVRWQDGRTANMIFDVPYLVWYLSQYMALHPGDVINTGTPAAVALGMRDAPYLGPGDTVDTVDTTVELEIDGLGSQRQTFARA